MARCTGKVCPVSHAGTFRNSLQPVMCAPDCWTARKSTTNQLTNPKYHHIVTNHRTSNRDSLGGLGTLEGCCQAREILLVASDSWHKAANTWQLALAGHLGMEPREISAHSQRGKSLSTQSRLSKCSSAISLRFVTSMVRIPNNHLEPRLQRFVRLHSNRSGDIRRLRSTWPTSRCPSSKTPMMPRCCGKSSRPVLCWGPGYS